MLRHLFDAAIAADDPARCVPPHMPAPPAGRTVVVGAGKAAAAMARAVEESWPAAARARLSGLVVTRYGHGVPCSRIAVIEAGHPLPDAAGADAARRILEAVSGLAADDLVLCLISGGASALLALPAPGITLADKQAVTRALLASGATIAEINTVRRHLSAIKGGRLALAAAPARVVTLLISDVPGDEPAAIGSGPTVADPTSLADARAVLARHGIKPPPAIAKRLSEATAETPKPGDPRLAAGRTTVVATPAAALEAAAEAARAAGLAPTLLGDAIEGEARDLGRAHAALARRQRAPALLLSGGECTVTLGAAGGHGGPNAEYALALALALDGAPGIFALAADTDGIDGSEDNAGAFVAPDSLAHARAAGRDPLADLAANESYGFFAAIGDLLITGPTRTNVNDFRAILVTSDGAATVPIPNTLEMP